MKNKKNYLLEKITGIFSGLKQGRVLDIGCGDGDYSKRLKDLGFEVVAGDIDEKRFRYQGEINFKYCNITRKLPFPDNSFDYVLLTEVIEHLKNPYDVIPEVRRIIKKDGFLIMSTPNILNLKSRLRFAFEGGYEYFREPPLDQAVNPKENIFNLHLFPYRYHELEYLLSNCGFKVSGIFASVYEGYGLFFLLPIIRFQAWSKQQRSRTKGGVNYRRINKIVLSKELLLGRHLIIMAAKQ